jgi:hypothetical protein
MSNVLTPLDFAREGLHLIFGEAARKPRGKQSLLNRDIELQYHPSSPRHRARVTEINWEPFRNRLGVIDSAELRVTLETRPTPERTKVLTFEVHVTPLNLDLPLRLDAAGDAVLRRRHNPLNTTNFEQHRETEMTNTDTKFKTLAALAAGVQTVKVSFSSDSARSYTYKVPQGLALDVGTKVYVSAKGSLRIATVVEVDEETDLNVDAGYDYAWVQQVVDHSLAQAAEQREDTLVDLLKRRQRANAAQQALAALGCTADDLKLLK